MDIAFKTEITWKPRGRLAPQAQNWKESISALKSYYHIIKLVRHLSWYPINVCFFFCDKQITFSFGFCPLCSKQHIQVYHPPRWTYSHPSDSAQIWMNPISAVLLEYLLKLFTTMSLLIAFFLPHTNLCLHKKFSSQYRKHTYLQL